MRAPVRNLGSVLPVFAALVSWPSFVLAQADECAEDLVYPPGEVVEGKAAGEWSARFWDWALRIPKSGHPMIEATGEHCAMGQEDEVFFLPGTVIGITLSGPRTECVVPCGRPIQVMIYSIVGWAPGDCPDPITLDTQCRACIHDFVAGIDAMDLKVDGRSVGCLEDHRAVSPLFESTMPEENLFELPEPLTRTFVAEGFYPILRPLAPGPHRIEFRAYKNPPEPPPPLLIYELTVGPCDAPAFRRGDCDGNGAVNVTDAVSALNFLFAGADPLPCLDAADSNDDGGLNVTDAVHTLLWLFQGGTVPPSPGPSDCGVDPTEDSLDCGKGC